MIGQPIMPKFIYYNDTENSLTEQKGETVSKTWYTPSFNTKK